MVSEPIAMHQAFEAAAERLYSRFEGARFERRSDLVVAPLPAVPIPQFNGVWVSRDSDAAVAAMGDAIAEVESSGAQASVQLRPGFDRTRQAAVELGLTNAEQIPGMAVRPGELVAARASLEIIPARCHIPGSCRLARRELSGARPRSGKLEIAIPSPDRECVWPPHSA